MNVVGLAGEKRFFYNHSAAVGRQFSKREAPQIVADAVEKQRALGSPSNCHRNQWNVLEQNGILSLETCKQTMLVGSFFLHWSQPPEGKLAQRQLLQKRTGGHLGCVPQ